MFSDAETTHEGFTADGFSNASAFSSKVQDNKGGNKTVFHPDTLFDVEAIRTRLDSLPVTFHGG